MRAAFRHAVVENRHGVCVRFELTPSVGVTGNPMALERLKHLEAEDFCPASVVGADKNCHNGPFVAGCRAKGIKPHVAPIEEGAGLGWAHDLQPGLRAQLDGAQTCRANLWVDEDGGRDAPQPLPGGAERTDVACNWAAAALDLLRLAKLSVSPPEAVVRA